MRRRLAILSLATTALVVVSLLILLLASRFQALLVPLRRPAYAGSGGPSASSVAPRLAPVKAAVASSRDSRSPMVSPALAMIPRRMLFRIVSDLASSQSWMMNFRM